VTHLKKAYLQDAFKCKKSFVPELHGGPPSYL